MIVGVFAHKYLRSFCYKTKNLITVNAVVFAKNGAASLFLAIIFLMIFGCFNLKPHKYSCWKLLLIQFLYRHVFFSATNFPEVCTIVHIGVCLDFEVKPIEIFQRPVFSSVSSAVYERSSFWSHSTLRSIVTFKKFFLAILLCVKRVNPICDS